MNDKVIEIRLPTLSKEQRASLKGHLEALIQTTRNHQLPPKFELTAEQRAFMASQAAQIAQAEKDPGNVVFVCDDEMRELLGMPRGNRLELSESMRSQLSDLPGETPGCKIWRKECVERNSYGHCLMWDWFCKH
jgi:hypothetical protein